MGLRRTGTRRGARACAALVGAALLGCVETRTHHPVGSGEVVALQRVPLVAAWDVVDHDRPVGSVARFESAGGDLVFVVRNVDGQDLGLVDGAGRIWRRRPHAPDELLGAGTLEDGARRVLEASAAARLVPRAPDPGSG